ncbi:MAG TPA: AMP-binding protein [Pyrinomonadaceae bacterium]|nr:AMP-binding protein [Pyrinomonadaceae bacterium]
MQDTNAFESQPVAWTPTPEVIERARLTQFMKQVGVSTWDELYEFSIRDVEKFTEEVVKFLDIKFDPPYEKLLDVSDGPEFPKWFLRNADAPVRNEDEARTRVSPEESASADEGVRVPTAGLNITTMCLDRWQTDEMKDQPAVIWEGEDGLAETISYSDLRKEVDNCAAGLIDKGLVKGDAVGIHLPMLLETIVALLAINRIGAVAVPVFSGYGVEAIASRMNAVQAKALFTFTGMTRRGKPTKPYGFEAAMMCPTIKLVIAIPPRHKVTSEQEDIGKITEAFQAMSEEERIAYRSDLSQHIRNLRDKPLRDPKQFRVDEEVSAGLRQKRDEQSKKNSVIFFLQDLKKERREFHGKGMLWKEPIDNREIGYKVKAEPTVAEDPLIILYTSGTTGKPKGIAHTHASFPIKAAQDMAFGTDVGKGTRICWYTDIGWMMGPWLIYGALINGATICIYDGAPDYPTPDRMWEFCAKHKVEVLGISPTLVRSLAAHSEKPTSSTGPQASRLPESGVAGGTPAVRSRAPFERFDLSSLRVLASTGEPWNPDPWWWLFNEVGGGKLPIVNYSGGTEIAGGILMGNPILPIKPCSFPAPCPGMDVDIFDENGKPVERGHVGELVIKQPWIGMARGFWEEKERYLDAYWRRFDGIWVHGDWAMEDADGCWYILGRSDDTLKVAGKRVGPAEVESILVSHPDVVEAAVIGVPDEVKGTAMVAIVVRNRDTGKFLAGGTGDSDEGVRVPLEEKLKALVAREMGKPLTPSAIHFVSALPKTRNAKVMRRVIRAAYLGEDAGDVSSLENPQTIDEIRKLNDR